MSIISVIIPTCDRREFLLEAIDSVLAQTLAPAEILIVNNGKEPLLLPENLATRVKIFDIMPYAGVAQARNFGVCLATGEIIAFLDDDDLWRPDYLANAMAALIADAELACVVSRQDKLENNLIAAYKNPHGKIDLPHLLVHNPGVGGPNVVMKKTAFFAAGGYDPKLPPSEDKSLILEMLRLGLKVGTLPDNAIIVRMHSGPRLTDNKRIIEGIFQFVRKYHSLMTWRQYLENWRKIYRYQYQGGRKISFVSLVFVTVVIKILKLINL